MLEIRHKKEHKLAEWEQIQQKLQALGQDLKDPLLDNEEKDDIKADIWGLKKRKNNVAVQKMDKTGGGK
jgi:uncharacterized protein YfkK (UPF0435 family)